MKRYRVKLWTGPVEVKRRAAYAADDVLSVYEGTEHIYLTLNAEDASHALDLARDAAGYVPSPKHDRRDSVVEVESNDGSE